jgi:hypothetical protein
MVGMLSNTCITTHVNVQEKSGDTMYFWPILQSSLILSITSKYEYTAWN